LKNKPSRILLALAPSGILLAGGLFMMTKSGFNPFSVLIILIGLSGVVWGVIEVVR
jgi:hypothetical protein